MTNLIRFGNLDEHVLSTWIFVFVRMPWEKNMLVGSECVKKSESYIKKHTTQTQVKYLPLFCKALVDLLDLSLTCTPGYP